MENNDTYQLDPYFQDSADRQQRQQDLETEEKEKYGPEKDSIPNVEASKQVEEDPREEQFNSWSHKIPVLGQIKYGLSSASLGVADFAFDAVGLVPWLKPADEWWDNNSPKANHPSHKIIRDASSVIIPSLAGGGAVVGGARAGTAFMHIPKYARTLGSIAAYTGVDTGVAMISSHSKTDDNLAGTLNNWLGWNLPWATRGGDSPDVRWKKNVMESAGLAGGVELLSASFAFAKRYKLFPRDEGAEQLINAKKVSLAQYEDPVTATVEQSRLAREAGQEIEMVEALKKDPTGIEGYNAFINDLGDDAASKAVQNVDADPLIAKLNHAQIQNNLDSINGRAAAVAPESFHKQLMKAIDGNERAQQLDSLFDAISPNFDAVVDGKRISAETMNRSVDNLTNAIYGKDLSLREFEVIVDDMKSTVFNSNVALDEDTWIKYSQAFKEGYDKLFDPNQMRASAMITQNAADNVTDAAHAAMMLGDDVDTSRQFEMMFQKANLLDTEVRVNDYIMSKAGEYMKLKERGNLQATASWITNQSEDFDTYLAKIRSTNDEFVDTLTKIAKEDPLYLRPLKDAFAETNGSVDSIDKLHQYAKKKLGFIKNGFINGDPEVPSDIVRGLHAATINGLLTGISSARAALGNATLSAIKPISVFAGATVTGDAATFKRAMYTFGCISENMKRGFRVMQKEWSFAKAYPEEAMMRGRVDLNKSKMPQLSSLDGMAEIYRRDGEIGKLAMYNINRGLGWWNKQFFTRYGTTALYAIDGFTNAFNAAGMARAKAYDALFSNTRGGFSDKKFLELQRKIYDEAFDATGTLTDNAAEIASREIALNLDSATVQQFERFLDYVPGARGLFLFPRTGANGFELGWSFNPVSNLGPALTRARRVLGATTEQSKLSALAEHGITPEVGMNMDLAFESLKAEYIGRQIMGSSVVMGLGMWAIEGNMTGSGSHDKAERARMMAMGWKPWSIKNPVTGEWRSYKGFEPFDTLMGLTADVVYQANRVDQAVTQDFFTKIAASIGMNITNGTFIQGFEPLVGLLSRDASAWNRFWAGQIDLTIPFKGPRSILNNLITPQLKDVENDITEYLKNANKFLFSGNENLKDLLDVYTGKPIRDYETLTNAVNAFLPMFKSNGGMEPWRQWLLSTGWDGLQRMRKNPETGLDLSTEDRHYINNYNAENGNLANQLIDLMMQEDDYWDSELKAYVKSRGLKDQSQYPAKKTLLYRRLDEIHDRAFEAAVRSLNAYKSQYTVIGREMQNRDIELGRGAFNKAEETQKRIQNLLFETRQK